MFDSAFSRAAELYDAGRFDLAERLITRDLEARPGDPASLALLGICLAQRHQHADALAKVHEALRLAPEMAFAHYSLAIVHLAHRTFFFRWTDLPRARMALSEAMRLEPSNPDQLSLLAAIELGCCEPRKALELAEMGLKVLPTHVGCINVRAEALQDLGLRREADKAFLTSLGIDPEQDRIHAARGWILHSLSQYQAAEYHFREALHTNPQNDWARDGLRDVLRRVRFVVPVIRLGLYLRLLRTYQNIARDGGSRVGVRPAWSVGVISLLTMAIGGILELGHVDSLLCTLMPAGIVLLLLVAHRRFRGVLTLVTGCCLAATAILWLVPFGILLPFVPVERFGIQADAGRVGVFAGSLMFALFVTAASVPNYLADMAAARILTGRSGAEDLSPFVAGGDI